MTKYRKALKNYTTEAKTEKMVADIQQILVDFGATGIGFGYAEGKISSINFQILMEGNSQVVSLPLFADKVHEVLRQQGVFGVKRQKGYNRNDQATDKELDQAYRTALATVRDWLDAQLAYLQTKQVDFPQLFLPYIQGRDGRTVYEVLKENHFTIGQNEQDI